MDNYEYTELLKKLNTKVLNICAIIKPENIKTRLKQIETLEQDENFWQDVAKATALGKEKTKISNMLEKFSNAKSAVDDAKDLYELANDENDEDTINALFDDAQNLEDKITSLEISMLLSGEDDNKNAIVSIHPGAGGTESNDWASMLYRMYLRFCEREGFKERLLTFKKEMKQDLKM